FANCSFAGEVGRARAGVVVKAAMVLGLWLLSLSAVSASVEIRERVGTARDAKSGEVLYRELHRERWSAGRILDAEVRYVDADGDAIGRKRIDFSINAVLPRFETRDHRSGHLEAGRLTDLGYVVRYREKEGAQFEVGTVTADEAMVADAGIDRKVARVWDDLVRGRERVFGLIIPSSQDVYDFRVHALAPHELPEWQDAPAWLVLKVVPENFLLRLAAPEILLGYDRQTRQLRRYVGPSNLRGADGAPLDVVIDYP
ncbi:MAG: hypothetical protein ACPGU7_11545, partial [Gammaproteobacteria bacterium]